MASIDIIFVTWKSDIKNIFSIRKIMPQRNQKYNHNLMVIVLHRNTHAHVSFINHSRNTNTKHSIAFFVSSELVIVYNYSLSAVTFEVYLMRCVCFSWMIYDAYVCVCSCIEQSSSRCILINTEPTIKYLFITEWS